MEARCRPRCISHPGPLRHAVCRSSLCRGQLTGGFERPRQPCTPQMDACLTNSLASPTGRQLHHRQSERSCHRAFQAAARPARPLHAVGRQQRQRLAASASPGGLPPVLPDLQLPKFMPFTPQVGSVVAGIHMLGSVDPAPQLVCRSGTQCWRLSDKLPPLPPCMTCRMRCSRPWRAIATAFQWARTARCC